MLCTPSTHTTNRLWSHAFCECTCTARIITSLGHLGFTRYKAPFCEALGAAVEDGFLPTCRRSYEDFWLPMLNYDTPAYNAKTRELPWEREPSVFFSALPSLAHEVPAEPAEPAVSDDSDAEDDEKAEEVEEEQEEDKDEGSTAMGDDDTEGTPKHEGEATTETAEAEEKDEEIAEESNDN